MKKIVIAGVFVLGSFITSQAQNADKVTREASVKTTTTVSSTKNDVNPDKQMPADRSTIATDINSAANKQNNAIAPRKGTVKVSPKNIENSSK